MTDPTLWYLNRGTGVSLLALLSLTTLLGVLATGRAFAPWWPRFVTQGLHRAMAGLSVALLLVHAVSAVVDEFVDIRWWHALLPFGGLYKPLPLALGTLALDLLVAVVVTSLLRERIGPRTWLLVHLLSYAAWVAAVVHGLLIGTDAGSDWFGVLTWTCALVVTVAGLARLGVVLVRRARMMRRARSEEHESAAQWAR